MLENLKSRLKTLEAEEKEIQNKITKDFNKDSIYINCGLMDNMEELIVIKAKIELLEELIDELE